MRYPRENQYPKTLKIGQEDYQIKFVDRIGSSRLILGEADPQKRLIRITRGQTPQETFQTFIHEIIHALFEFENDMKIPHKYVYKMEKAVDQFLKDNF